MPQKVLILSRKYPPSIGGMQAYSRNFINHMSALYSVDKIVLGKGQINLIWFLPYMFFKSLRLMIARKYDAIYLCDAALAPFGVIFKTIFGVKALVTAHGLDITYDKCFYQKIVPWSVSKLDRVICVSHNTVNECTKRGISGGRCRVITNGIEPDEYALGVSEADVTRHLGEDAKGKKVLVTVGRLIRRKGIGWFIENIMPRLDDNYLYVVAGDGPERGKIKETIRISGMEERVKLLGRVRHETLKFLYNSAYAMVLPNQRVENDPEGFGIVAIEAAGCGLPVIANSVDAAKEAVLDGKTGWLVNYNDSSGFLKKIEGLDLARQDVKEASSVFRWDNIIKQYQKEIDAL